MCVDPQKAWRWYRDVLSGFTHEESMKRQHEHDVEVYDRGIKRTIRVPILKKENIGKRMAIDEKKIGEHMHTILSNGETGKIALVAKTVKASDLSLLIPKFDLKNFEVKTITRDLSNTYDWFSRQAFQNAEHVADKFHIIRNLLDAQQSVRIRYRQDLLREKRLKYDTYKVNEKQRKKSCKRQGLEYKKNKFTYRQNKLDNGETALEILARSRFLLYKYSSDWTDSQRERAIVLFKHYPEIKRAYELSLKFRTWYRKENIKKEKQSIINGLKQWYSIVDKADIDEISNFKSSVERNQTAIIAYFNNGHTNAIAENINSKIQRFVNINQGTRDKEFFYFRMANYFS